MHNLPILFENHSSLDITPASGIIKCCKSISKRGFSSMPIFRLIIILLFFVLVIAAVVYEFLPSHSEQSSLIFSPGVVFGGSYHH